MQCASCGAAAADGQKFCGECGARLTRACPACGAAAGPTQKFCGECGTPIAATTAPLARAAATTSVASGPNGAAAELRIVSVLFVDLVGYTTLSEGRDAEDVRELLSRYFETAKTIVGRYGGTIEKFIGDAVMAIWGAPVAREDDAERAVRAGLEFVSAVSAFGQDVGAPGLRARAGVVTGQVAALANPDEGLVVGDRVNTASRVQSIADPGTVYVDDVTRGATAAAISYEDTGEHTVKGKAEPLRLWRATRVVAGVAGSQRSDALEAPFVGRESELRMVKELFHASIDRRGARLVAVSGPAGVGKTRLRWEFEKYVDGLKDDVLWHSGRCLSYGDGVAYWALTEMVRQRLGIAEEAPLEDAARKLAVGLERWVIDPGEREFLSPRLGVLLGTAEPGLGRDELFAGWRLFFERLTTHDPLVLVFEDVQWADSGLLDFIEHLLEWSAGYPIFMVTFARPELAERRERWAAGRRGATPLYLEPLADGPMAELLDGLVEGLPADARARIVAQAEGIPLYAIETVRALADRRVLVRRDDRLAAAGELGELDVPATLSSLLASRLDALEPDERELIRSTAVFGGSFPRSAAAALGDVPEDRLDAVLTSLVRKEILIVRADPLSPDRGQYAFAQTLLRTVAYDMLSRHDRKARHLAAAAHLREAFPNDGEDIAEVIAAHLLDAYRAAAGDDDADELRSRALDALRRAAQRAAAVGAPEAAERAYRTSRELAGAEEEHLALTAAAGEMALKAGRLEAALELLESVERAHTAAGRGRDAALLSRHIGQALWSLGRLAEGVERMRAALAVLEPAGADPEAAALSAEIARAYTFIDLPQAGPFVESALSMAQALELPDVLCEAMTTKGVVYLFSGRREEARALLEAAIETAEREGLSAELARAQANCVHVYLNWDLETARKRAADAVASDRRLGDAVSEGIDTGVLMHVHTFAGRWGEAERLAAELLDGGSGEHPGADYIHHRLAPLQAMHGDAAGAAASLAALGSWKHSDNAEQRGLHAATGAIVALATGDAERALALAGPTAREHTRIFSAVNEVVVDAWPVAVEAALALGRVEEAADLVEFLAAAPPGHVPPYLRAQLSRARALLAAARGDHDAVEVDLASAIERFAALGYPYWLARAQVELGAWLIERGRTHDARPPLEKAAETLERLGAAPLSARARELLAAVPAAAVA